MFKQVQLLHHIINSFKLITQKIQWCNYYSYSYTILMIITINKGRSQPEIFTFNNNQRKVIIGRNPKISEGEQDNVGSIIVQQPSASRTHLEVSLKGNSIKVKDLGSSNGTKINNKAIEPNIWMQIRVADQIQLGQSTDKIQISTQNKKGRVKDRKNDQSREKSSKSDKKSRSSSSNSSRSRQKKKRKFEVLCRDLKISDSSLKMIKQMTSEKKSKEQRIKFLKLMGCKNIESNWEQIQLELKNQNKYTNSKKANEELQKQFDSGRGAFQKKGLGSR